jgi:NADH-quinone oxidoreductase subunit D
LVYDRFDFDIPIGTVGDIYDRYRVRIEEMRQSVRILEQAIEQLPQGDICAKVPNLLRPPKGEAYARVESQTGELGFYLVSDGSIAPYRFRVRSPELLNLTVLREISLGWKIADLIAIFASIDIALGEVDR